MNIKDNWKVAVPVLILPFSPHIREGLISLWITELNPFSKLFSEMNPKQLCKFQEKITHALVDFITSVLGTARNYLGPLCILYLPVKGEGTNNTL